MSPIAACCSLPTLGSKFKPQPGVLAGAQSLAPSIGSEPDMAARPAWLIVVTKAHCHSLGLDVAGKNVRPMIARPYPCVHTGMGC